MWAVVALVVALGGCFTKPDLAFGDAGPGDSVDAHVACTGMFEMPMQVAPVNAANFDNESPAISPDGKILAFTSNRDGSDDIWYAVKAGTTFGVPLKVPGMTAAIERQPSWSHDGAKLFFEIGSAPWSSTRRPGEVFSAPVADGELDGFIPGLRPRFTADGLQAVYYADSPAEIYLATRTSTALPWAPGVKRTDINSANPAKDDRFPALSSDGLTISFTSDRDTSGTYQLFIADRTTTDGLFSPATRVGLAGESVDMHPDFSRDGTELYFSRSVTNGRNVFVATRACN